MKVEIATINPEKLYFAQNIYYGVEDGLPEGYTLWLGHTATPMKDRDVIYSNDCINGWSYSPQTLTLMQDKPKKDGGFRRTVLFEETITTNCLYWLDILAGIICYSSSAAKYENFVLYNIFTDKKLVIDYKYVEDHAKVLGYTAYDQYNCFYEPTLFVRGNLLFVRFEGFIGSCDPESDGMRVFCFNKDTLEPVDFENSDLDSYEAEDSVYEREEAFNGTTNLYPSSYRNRYNQKELSTKITDTARNEHTYLDVPKSLIKEMRKLRVAWAKENGIRVEKFKYYKDSIYKKLAHFFERLENRRFERYLKRQRKKEK